ncbi:MAG TPA: LON peptidase substrate-binding domain-containing protein [Pilimelia sp.]|nr:LON peptidase substrate-binding domain-containing protein [Pilimelia sp.]
MTSQLPLFPLGTVLFPGLVLPLHVFEERYRALVRHLMELPGGRPREFGVVAVRHGGEPPAGAPAPPETAGQSSPPARPTGPGRPPPAVPGEESRRSRGEEPTEPQREGPTEPRAEEPDRPAAPGADTAPPVLHEVGCTAELRQVTEHPDGRFDIVTVGRRRFRVLDVDLSAAPFLVARVEWLPEPPGREDAADELAPRVLAVFRRYLALLRPPAAGGTEVAEQLPDDPTVLSHLIAATAALTLEDRQRLLVAPDTASRLRAELRLLNRETALLRRVRAVPVPLAELAAPTSAN